MLNTLDKLKSIAFPPIRRGRLTTLQVNVGYVCNQQCQHCHVNAGPNRKEDMGEETFRAIIDFLQTGQVSTLDITGGAPELNRYFRPMVVAARGLGIEVIDRCNLTVLTEPGQEDLAEFLAGHQVHVVASLPCYLEENVDAQRGKGVFEQSLTGLRKLNDKGYGDADGQLKLDLVYNPQDASLPPAQCALESDYHQELDKRYGVRFNQLLTLANMPIARFGSTLLSKGLFDDYMALLQGSHSEGNMESVMCKSLVSVDWQGYLYDCDFNQMLGLPLGGHRTHLSDFKSRGLQDSKIEVAGHCYGCTAGQGSSCGGALN